MSRIDFQAHFVTKDYVRAMEEIAGYPRYSVDGQTGRRRLEYTDDAGEPLGDMLLNRLCDTGEQRRWVRRWKGIPRPTMCAL
jgi:hypothetical protein